MIARIALFSVFCVFAALSAPITINDIPEQYRELIPKEAQEFLTGLTDEDKAALKEWSKQYAAFKNEDEALAALKVRSPSLGEKAEKLHLMVKEKVDALGDEAKAFANEVIGMARKLQAQIVAGQKPSIEELKGKAHVVIGKYNALSSDAKADLQKQFPIISSVVKNEKFKKMAETFLGKAN